MTKPKRELRTIPISGKITDSLNVKMIKKCEKENISVSEYLNKLIQKDVKS